MKRYRAVLNSFWVPALSGCMTMGGMGHLGGMGDTDSTMVMNTMGVAASEDGSQAHVLLVSTQASSDDLTIELSFPLPSGPATVPIDVRLRSDGGHHELADAEVWLKVLSPEGKVDEIGMHHAPASAAGAFQAQYSFPAPGLYVVRAESRVGKEAGTCAAWAGTEIEIGGKSQGMRAHGRQRGWLAPTTIVGGLSMVVMMALMVAP